MKVVLLPWYCLLALLDPRQTLAARSRSRSAEVGPDRTGAVRPVPRSVADLGWLLPGSVARLGDQVILPTCIHARYAAAAIGSEPDGIAVAGKQVGNRSAGRHGNRNRVTGLRIDRAALDRVVTRNQRVDEEGALVCDGIEDDLLVRARQVQGPAEVLVRTRS